jgi:hypothetical protein
MKSKDQIIKELSPHLFWDVDINQLDYRKDKCLIIERILVYGKENDERLLNMIYSKNCIKSVAKKSMNLNDRTICYLSEIYNIPEEKFRCYKKKPY